MIAGYIRQVAEPLARRSRAMTLFVPRTGKGFVSLENGAVTLKRILIPIDHVPRSQTALRRVFLLARGLDCAAGEFRLIHVGNPGTAPRIRLTEHEGWSYEIMSDKATSWIRFLRKKLTGVPT